MKRFAAPNGTGRNGLAVSMIGEITSRRPASPTRQS
jgi:hypothetical protein